MFTICLLKYEINNITIFRIDNNTQFRQCDIVRFTRLRKMGLTKHKV